MSKNTDARLLVRVYEASGGRQGAATVLIEADDASAIPASLRSEGELGPVSRFLTQQDALLLPELRAGDPRTYLAPSEEPLPGSLKSRLVRLIDEGYLFSDSIVFTQGPVLAVVTVWYPDEEGPFEDVEQLAARISERLGARVDAG